MNITAIIFAALVVGGTGLFIGVFLGVAGKKFAVETDPREESIGSVLPGNNCGGCGYAGCLGLASAIVKGEAAVNACPVGGAPVADKIAAIMGMEAGNSVHKVAFVKCAGTCDKAGSDYTYYGIKDCTMASMMQNGGQKSCNYGCLGYGSCVKACPFDAIHIVDGIAVVDKDAFYETFHEKSIKGCQFVTLAGYKGIVDTDYGHCVLLYGWKTISLQHVSGCEHNRVSVSGLRSYEGRVCPAAFGFCTCV